MAVFKWNYAKINVINAIARFPLNKLTLWKSFKLESYQSVHNPEEGSYF